MMRNTLILLNLAVSTLHTPAPSCPNHCSGRGECDQIGVDAAVCRCQPGYGGADCSLRVCPNDCSGHGHCRAPSHEPLSVQHAWAPTCECHSGFTGFDCSLRACPEGCNGRGYCYNATCRCFPGFTGSSCALAACPN